MGSPSPPPQDEIDRLTRQVEALSRTLKDREELLRRSMVEKGERLLEQLETAHVRAHAEADHRRRDPLTQLLRHGHFRIRLDFEVSRSREVSQPMALLLLDLDRFGEFNQRHGYEAGDSALAYVGRALQSAWLSRPGPRPPALGREGADCFGIILPAADEQEASVRAESLCELVERLPLPAPGLTASLGGAVLLAPGRSGRELLEAAQAALLRARAEGGNRVELELLR